jgi:hypothetical protein
MTAGIADIMRAKGIALKHYRPGNQRVSCPPCNKGPRDTNLSVTINGDGCVVWQCFSCRWTGAWRPRQERGRTTSRRREVSASIAMQAPLKPKGWSTEAEALARQIEPDHEILRNYFAVRGCGSIATPSHALGFLRPGVGGPHTLPGWPRMVGIITDAITNRPISLHFTALAQNGSGKAPIERPKRLLAGHRKAGGVIRITPDDSVTYGLGVAEGIETSLAVLAGGWAPIWATVDAGNMACFPVLHGIESLAVWADNDESSTGQKSADECATRWRNTGREAVIMLPPAVGQDWNDLARAS